MHLVEILLPLTDNDGAPFPQALYDRVRAGLTERFGGLTAFTRAPAVGLWKDDDTNTRRDDIVIFEVMTETLDRAWWRTYRESLQAAFAQEALIVRATAVETL